MKRILSKLTPQLHILTLTNVAFVLFGCGRSAEETQVKEGEIRTIDPALDVIVPSPATIEKLADGVGFAEGPVWSREGYFLFSDLPANPTPAASRLLREGQT